LLLTYISTTILSVISNDAFVAIPLILISTGVVLLFSQPISTGSPLNNKVLSPPVEFTLDTL
jgi:hypothetical protein